MADQSQIDNSAIIIADLVDKAKAELIADLYKLGIDVSDVNLQGYVDSLFALDVEGTLKAKLQKATAVYANAHREVLESTIGFASVDPNTLTSLVKLNEQLFDKSIINTISGHIRTEVVKGLQAGLTAKQIIQNVSQTSISNAQIQTLINTTLNSYSRVVTNQMMDTAPNNTKFVYIGPADEKTRDECLKYIRAGRLTKQQIIDKGWRETLVNGGGFNCRHKWEVASEEGTTFYEEKEAKEIADAG